jgi:hypothetical protein
MAKAVGVGGIFLRARDPRALVTWYATHLGIPRSDEDSLVFQGPEAAGMTVFAVFPQNTAYFGDGLQTFMVNSFGRFAWIWDPEGNRVELWEPLPAV